ncbi:hypothetical protein FNH22_19170 [Fulvivirga sp. M361]|uniref:hypothetical protein n=1 Tax=Fulvivirga sp. M361 TaxID=2594266 RepID=UPI001179DF99|nr:hypothetical protein [Fulvivirga sp. M361]TRX54877.1 hypothetical protein FNH22_19170 [Fulvivirga sp. M361]
MITDTSIAIRRFTLFVEFNNQWFQYQMIKRKEEASKYLNTNTVQWSPGESVELVMAFIAGINAARIKGRYFSAFDMVEMY